MPEFGIWHKEAEVGVEEKIYKRTSINSTGFRQKKRMGVDMSDYITEGVLFIEYENE